MNFFFQAEDGIRYLVRSRGLGDVYKRQIIYPNPSGGRFTIKLQNWESNEILVKVDNSIGEEIYLRQFFNTQSIEIKLPESFSGIAIMTIFDESNMISKVLYILE